MKTNPEKKQSRRQLFTAALRYAALAFFGAAAGASFVKGRRLIRQGKCINNTPGQSGCRGCKIINSCSLPQALSARKVLGLKK